MTIDKTKAIPAWNPQAAAASIMPAPQIIQSPQAQETPWQDPAAIAPISPYIPTVQPSKQKTDRQKLAESMASSGVSSVAGKPAGYKSQMQKTGESMAAEGYSHVGDLGPQTTAPQPTQGQDPSTKAPVDSAIEIANAKPDNVGDVLDKIADEEKKGGPNFWDVIEAATAGWNGKTPLYVQKAVAKKNQENELSAMQKQSDLQKQAAEESRASENAENEKLLGKTQAFQSAQADKEAALRRELAGLAPVGQLGTSRLSLQGFAPGLASSGVKK